MRTGHAENFGFRGGTLDVGRGGPPIPPPYWPALIRQVNIRHASIRCGSIVLDSQRQDSI